MTVYDVTVLEDAAFVAAQSRHVRIGSAEAIEAAADKVTTALFWVFLVFG